MGNDRRVTNQWSLFMVMGTATGHGYFSYDSVGPRNTLTSGLEKCERALVISGTGAETNEIRGGAVPIPFRDRRYSSTACPTVTRRPDPAGRVIVAPEDSERGAFCPGISMDPETLLRIFRSEGNGIRPPERDQPPREPFRERYRSDVFSYRQFALALLPEYSKRLLINPPCFS